MKMVFEHYRDFLIQDLQEELEEEMKYAKKDQDYSGADQLKEMIAKVEKMDTMDEIIEFEVEDLEGDYDAVLYTLVGFIEDEPWK